MSKFIQSLANQRQKIIAREEMLWAPFHLGIINYCIWFGIDVIWMLVFYFNPIWIIPCMILSHLAIVFYFKKIKNKPKKII